MPRATDAISRLHSHNSTADFDDISDYLVARHPGEGVAEIAGRNHSISVADAASEDLDENLFVPNRPHGDVLESQW